MRKFGAFLLLLAVIAILGGMYIQKQFESDEAVTRINAVLDLAGAEKVNPSFVQKLLSSGVTLMGKEYTLKDLLSDGITILGQEFSIKSLLTDVSNESLPGILNAMQLYALSPKLIWGGIAGGILGFLLLCFGGSKRK